MSIINNRKFPPAGRRQFDYVDGAHFVYRQSLAIVWCFSRIFMKTPAGRQRLNVLGAPHAAIHQFQSIINDSRVTAPTVCDLRDRVRNVHGDEPFTLILDNARYQHCRLVMDHVAKQCIELTFLPAYSPNLNLIERLWKYIKKGCFNGPPLKIARIESLR